MRMSLNYIIDLENKAHYLIYIMQLSELLNELKEIDDNIKSINEKLKVKRDRRKQLSDAIISYMKKNSLSNLENKNKTCSFVLKTTKSFTTISQKLIKDALYKKLKKNEADDIISSILKERKESNEDNLVIKLNK